MTWSKAIDNYVGYLVAGGQSPGTVRNRRHYLQLLARHHPGGPWTATEDDLVAVLARHGWSPETRKSCRATLRGFYAWAHRRGHLDDDPALYLPTVRVPAGKPRPVPERHVSEALDRADDDERLMVYLAVLAGLRRAEIARVHTADVHDEGGHLLLRVTGKGGKVRNVPLHPHLVAELEARPEGYVFPGADHGHLSPDWVGRRLSRLLPRGWSGHTLRHRFATDAYAVERDTFAVQHLLGHSRPETTARYTAVPDPSLRSAVLALRADWAA